MSCCLQKDHITDLFVLIDNAIPKKLKTNGSAGRLPNLNNSELVTILVWNVLAIKQKTLKDLHRYSTMHLDREFPKIPKYNAFLDHCHRVTGILLLVLKKLLNTKSAIKFIDSTMVEVCKNQRADSHKVARAIADFGKNHQGWHYGFKLHAAFDAHGRLCGFALTPASIHDSRALEVLSNKYTKVIVGDSAYGGKAMYEHIYERDGTLIISPPHYKQTKKIAALWQNILLNLRSKVESNFDYLKNHLHLVTSFPRSVKGFLFHYVRILLGYQIGRLINIQATRGRFSFKHGFKLSCFPPRFSFGRIMT